MSILAMNVCRDSFGMGMGTYGTFLVFLRIIIVFLPHTLTVVLDEIPEIPETWPSGIKLVEYECNSYVSGTIL